MNKANLICCILLASASAGNAFVGTQSSIGIDRQPSEEAAVPVEGSLSEVRAPSRRNFVMAGVSSLAAVVSVPKSADARFVLDDETGEFVEVEEQDWQTAWRERLDKASSMSKDEIFQAARGAGNNDLRQGPESDSSKKRRAMSACRDPAVRSKAQAGSEKECTARVFGGEVDFLLEAL